MSRKIGVVLSYVLMIMEVLSTLLITPFIIRTLGQAEYGVYKLIAAITAYLLLLDLGVGNAIIRFISKYRVNNDKRSESLFLGVASVFYIAIAMVAIIAGIVLIIIFPYAFSKGLTSSEVALGQKLLLITTFNVGVTLASAPYVNALLAYEKFGLSRGVSIVQIAIRMGLTIICLKLGMASYGIVLINLFTTVIFRLFFVFYSFAVLKLKPKLKGVSKSFVREITIYSSLIFLQMIATQINAGLDQILIGSLVANSSIILAVYAIGAQITQYFQSIGSAFNSVLMPGIVKICEKTDNPDILTNEMVRIGRFVIIVLGIVFVGFVLYGRQFIILWAGKDNIDSYYVATILMIAYIFTLSQSIGGQMLWAKNLHKEQSILKIAIVIANIFLTILLIRWNPLIGATLGTFISIFTGDVIVTNIIFKKKLKIKLTKLYFGYSEGLLFSLLVAFLCGLGFKHFGLSGWVGLIAGLAFTIIIYLACMLFFGFNKYEKSLIHTFCVKLFKRGKK